MDDPRFMASLSELDSGLGDAAVPDEPVPPPPRSRVSPSVPAPPAQSAAPPPVPLASIFPESAFMPRTPPASRFARAAAQAQAGSLEPVEPPRSQADGPRALIDLFPPPIRERAPGPIMAGAPAPRVHSRFGVGVPQWRRDPGTFVEPESSSWRVGRSGRRNDYQCGVVAAGERARPGRCCQDYSHDKGHYRVGRLESGTTAHNRPLTNRRSHRESRNRDTPL